MFLSVDEDFYSVDQLVQNAEVTVKLAMQRNMPPEDIQLIQDAFRHMLDLNTVIDIPFWFFAYF